MSHLQTARDHGGAAHRRALGAALMAAAMLIIPCADAIGKYLSGQHAPLFLGWARYAAGAAFVIPAFLLAGRGAGIARGQVPVQALRAAFLAGSLSLYYLAIARIPLADALGAYFVAPILATLLSAVFLGEALNPRRLLAVGIGFVGALLVARPGMTMDAGMAYALAAGGCMACYMVATRAVAQSGSPLATLSLPVCGRRAAAARASPARLERPYRSGLAAYPPHGPRVCGQPHAADHGLPSR